MDHDLEPTKNVRHGLVAVLVTLALAACSDSSDNGQPAPVEPEPEPAPFAEIVDQGVTRYLGEYTPMSSDVDGDVITHTFGTGDGPMCFRGSEFRMSTRDQGSEDLVIYLQGGGACWSDLCLANEDAESGIVKAGILDPELAENPVKDWNVVYLPYCDGSLHAGDVDYDDDGDGMVDRAHRGLHNLSAALDVAVTTFPAPRRIFLTGISGGGYGTTFALPLVRSLYPDVPIDMINDSGVGVGRPGEPEFIEGLIEEWNASAFVPASCTDCTEDGHFTNYHKWQLSEDPQLRTGMMSYKQDVVIANTFAAVGGPEFEVALLEEMADLESAHPERMHSFIADGASHTFLLTDLGKTVGGVTVMDWVSAMLDGSADWISTIDE